MGYVTTTTAESKFLDALRMTIENTPVVSHHEKEPTHPKSSTALTDLVKSEQVKKLNRMLNFEAERSF